MKYKEYVMSIYPDATVFDHKWQFVIKRVNNEDADDLAYGSDEGNAWYYAAHTLGINRRN